MAKQEKIEIKLIDNLGKSFLKQAYQDLSKKQNISRMLQHWLKKFLIKAYHEKDDREKLRNLDKAEGIAEILRAAKMNLMIKEKEADKEEV